MKYHKKWSEIENVLTEMKFCIKQKCCDVKQISQWKTIPKQLTIFTMVMRSWPTKGLLIQEKINVVSATLLHGVYYVS